MDEMRASSRKIVSLLMLIVFLMGLGAYGFNSKWLAHELDRQTLGVLADHDHAPRLDAKGDPDPGPLSDTEHQLLHAAGHFQPLLISSILDGFGEAPARVTPMLPCLLALPPAEIEPLFRPPRTLSRI
jgi:hypothetical protein